MLLSGLSQPRYRVGTLSNLNPLGEVTCFEQIVNECNKRSISAYININIIAPTNR